MNAALRIGLIGILCAMLTAEIAKHVWAVELTPGAGAQGEFFFTGRGAITGYPSPETLQRLAENGYPTAGIRSLLAGKYVYDDGDPRIPKEYRNGKARVMSREDFEWIVPADIPVELRLSLYRVLVEGEKEKVEYVGSGRSFSAFEKRCQRYRDEADLLPRPEHFQRHQFDDRFRKRKKVEPAGRLARPRNRNSASWVEETI